MEFSTQGSFPMTLPTPIKHVAAIMREAEKLHSLTSNSPDTLTTPTTPNNHTIHHPEEPVVAPIQNLAHCMWESLESSSARFLVSETPIGSRHTPIPTIFQTPPHRVQVPWVRFVTPEVCQLLDPQALIREIRQLRDGLLKAQEENTSLVERLIVSYTQLVLGSQYNEQLRCQLASKENKKRATNHKILMGGLPQLKVS